MKHIKPGTLKRMLLAGILGIASCLAFAQAQDAQRTFE